MNAKEDEQKAKADLWKVLAGRLTSNPQSQTSISLVPVATLTEVSLADRANLFGKIVLDNLLIQRTEQC